MRARKLIVAGITLLILLTSTQLAAAQSGSLPPEILGSDWALVSLQSAPGTVQDTTGKGMTVRFDADGSVSGSGGCNNFRGGYTIANGKITFTQFASTLKACEQEIADREQAYLTALQAATSFTFDGSARLQLTGGSGQMLSYTKSQPTTLPATGAASDTGVLLALFGALCYAGGLLLYRRQMLARNTIDS